MYALAYINECTTVTCCVIIICAYKLGFYILSSLMFVKVEITNVVLSIQIHIIYTHLKHIKVI